MDSHPWCSPLPNSLLSFIPRALAVIKVLPTPEQVTIEVAPRPPVAERPDCGMASRRIHSVRARVLHDLPWQGRSVTMRVSMRRFRCSHQPCARQTFTERLPEVVRPWGRRTKRLADIQCYIGFALGGEPGSRLARRLSLPLSGDTLLRLVRIAELEAHPSPRIVGIDDWAWRRGRRYGTIVCDLERRRVIDVLPDRSAETVASWLRQHPGVEVVARDRAGAYAEGVRKGAPQAKQVADRWHLLRNLGDALQRAVDRCHVVVRRAARAVSQGAGAAPEETSPVTQDVKGTRSRADRRARRLARYEELQRLHASGLPMREIAPALGMSAVAAYRWLKAGSPPTHDKPAQPRSLDPYVAHLEVRWREGCRNGWRLWREVRQRGFTGAVNAVARWVARQRRIDPPLVAEARSAATWPEPSSRRCARLLTTPTDKLEGQESEFRAHLAQMAPDLTRAGELAIRCIALIRNAPEAGSGPLLDTWLIDARGTALDAFARGVERDREAVMAALVEPWSTGPVEGQINRLKLLKRTMYGRAGYDLLRRRVLNAA